MNLSLLPYVFGLPLLALTPVSGESPAPTVQLTSPVADGSADPAPPSEPVLPVVQVKETMVTSVGDHQLILSKVAPLQLPAVPTETPQPGGADHDQGESGDSPASTTQLVCISATVYDHGRTLVRWYSGNNSTEEMTAWSNVDFNHFSGFSSFKVTKADGSVKEFALMMGLGNEDSQQLAEQAQQSGDTYTPPSIPALPPLDQGPAYLVTKGDPTDPAAMEVIDGLHQLYRTEGAHLKTAWEGRERAENERNEFLKLNPPQPEDVKIYYWRKAR